MRKGAPWRNYNIHDFVGVRANTSTLGIPSYFVVDSVTPDLEVTLQSRLNPPTAHEIQREVGHTVYDLGDRQILYETDIPLMNLLDSKARWRFRVTGLNEPTTRIVTGVPYFRLPPVRQRVSELLWRITHLMLMTKLLRKGVSLCYAAAVARGADGYLFFGFGGTGKSTLVTSLLERGFEYLSDDYTIVDSDGRAFCYPDLHDARAGLRNPLAKFFGLQERLRVVPRVRKQAQVRTIFLLERGPEGILELEKEDAIRKIMVLNLDAVSLFYNSPISEMFGAYEYLYPTSGLEQLVERSWSIMTAVVSMAERCYLVRTNRPLSEAVTGLISLGEEPTRSPKGETV